MSIRDWENLTEASRRLIVLANAIATDVGADVTQPEHLLEAMTREESLAGSWLGEFGYPTAFEDEITIGEGPLAEPNAALQTVLMEAQIEAFRLGPGAAVGSEHLLWGLAVVPSTAAERLAGHGITTEQLMGRLREPGASEEPHKQITIDWSLPADGPTSDELAGAYRILDAAANRAREGLRTFEDFARFVEEDRQLTAALKSLRHELRQALDRLDDVALAAHRDTAGDLGTSLVTEAEYRRRSPLDAALASCKRVQESLRTLEEYGKIVDVEFARRIEQLRYQSYTLEKMLRTGARARSRLADQRLYLLLSTDLCPLGPIPLLKAALRSGVRLVQLREKSLSDRQLLELAREVRHWTSEASALFIMNDRPDIAAMARADGVHLGQDDCPVAEAKRILGADSVIGVSTHTIEQARQAVRDGADYLGVGPTFVSSTKSFEAYAGLEFVGQVAREIDLPWFAIGGIDPLTVYDAVAAGARRVAVSGAICGSLEPGDVIRGLRLALEQATPAGDSTETAEDAPSCAD